jgi:GT2 family glycosyltransferase
MLVLLGGARRRLGAPMKISVVIPTFNNARYLPLAVRSARHQTLTVDEIIVIDDGSTDDTAKAVASLGTDVRYLRQDNRGPAAARNLGVDLATGELVAFLDADDEWMPTTAEWLCALFSAYPAAVLATGDMCAVDSAGALTEASWFASRGLSAKVAAWDGAPVPNAVAEIVRRNFVGTSVAMVRRSDFVALDGFRRDLRYGEDLELWARLATRGQVFCLPKVLGRRRGHASNTTKSIEPMLRGLVQMSETIRDWGAEILRSQGLDAGHVVAEAKTDLGYWLFSNGRPEEARQVLRSAVLDRPSRKNLRLLALSHLPSSLTTALRRARDGVRN